MSDFISFTILTAEPICPIDNEPIKVGEEQAVSDDYPGLFIHTYHLKEPGGLEKAEEIGKQRTA